MHVDAHVDAHVYTHVDCTGHTRLRQQAESVAFLNGGDREARSMDAMFDRLTRHSNVYIERQVLLKHSFIDSAL